MRRWMIAGCLALLVAGCGQPQDTDKAANKNDARAAVSTAAPPSVAVPAPAAPADVAAIRARMAKEFPQMKDAVISASVIPGLYQITKGALVGYISADGKYLIEGDLMEIATRRNLTEEARAGWRKTQLAGLDEKDMIIFEPKKVQQTITVFTDVECPYCRRLQADMGKLMEHGIRVRYMFMPVHGPKSIKEAGWVWCAKDRKQAFEDAMQGGGIL